MYSYRIQHKIKTPAALCFFDEKRATEGTTIEINWYGIRNWSYSEMNLDSGGAWLVTKTVRAKDWVHAINGFLSDFHSIAAKLSLATQCEFWFLGHSFLIENEDINPDKFLVRFVYERSASWLVFDRKRYEIFERLHSISDLNDLHFLHYFQEAALAKTYYSRVSLLLSSLEALAWKEEKETVDENGQVKMYTTYNKEVLKRIVGSKKFDLFFGANWLRHKIHHGEFVPSLHEEDHATFLYERIIQYLNYEYYLGIDTETLLVPRSFETIDTILGCFRKEEEEAQVDLSNITKENLDTRISTFLSEFA